MPCHRVVVPAAVSVAILLVGCQDPVLVRVKDREAGDEEVAIYHQEPEPFARITEGQTREQVAQLVDEPSRVVQRPFGAEFQSPCSDAAQVALVYTMGKEEKVIVFLDEQDRVLCKMHSMTLQHQ